MTHPRLDGAYEEVERLKWVMIVHHEDSESESNETWRLVLVKGIELSGRKPQDETEG